ncbi:MAG: ATP-grasp domain-containing protein [Acidobacteria bacterium]|nr:ATP-grasp domain-containing protein [Acidobacteriota bacterium]
MNKRSFDRVLIANRGEIAVRVMRTCRKLGISTIAVYSDADINAPHTRIADEAVHLGPAPARDSYLNISKIIDAALRTGAQAVHPGYGFLSENAGFADACAAAGLVFIGPSPQVIRMMGNKSAARRLVAKVEVPVAPGYDGEDQCNEMLRSQIVMIGFPVLIKASAGGGGKGMRFVRNENEIEEAIEAARREAEKSFGDGSLLLERFIEHARHIEMQIIGDNYDNLIHLFERDCSIQRRHQKIIEESPVLDHSLRQALGDAAVKIGQAIGYTNAGTVEFILAPSGEFYFIEVNTRLQVEHPVTEMITGLDLVRLQIEVAEGKPLAIRQDEVQSSGHAIEARLYAEDPDHDFLPSTGNIYDWQLTEPIEGLRIDTGVARSTEIGIDYDPLLAKFIAHGADRDEARRKLIYTLRAFSVQGLKTNREFLLRVLENEDFRSGKTHTDFISKHYRELINIADELLDRVSLAAITLYLQRQWRNSDELSVNLPPVYRNNPFRDPSVRLRISGMEADVSWRQIEANTYRVKIFDSSIEALVVSCDSGKIRLTLDGIQRTFRITEVGDRFYLHSSLGSRVVERLSRHPIRQVSSEHGTAHSPMPGQVLKIMVEAGQKVIAGDPLVILEAMKMEHTMRAVVDGVVEAVLVNQGEVVRPGQVLVQIAGEITKEKDEG